MTQVIKIKIHVVVSVEYHASNSYIARLLHFLLFLHSDCAKSRAKKAIFFKEGHSFININFDFILNTSKQNTGTGISLRFVYQNIANHEWHIFKLLTQVTDFNGAN